MAGGPHALRTSSPRVAVAIQLVGGSQEARVRVRGRYEPDTIIARAGRPLRLTFRREETAPCSERVVFPAFGKSATLPPFRDVTVELAAAEPGEYDFTCQLGMLHGRILVRPSRRVNLAARLPWRGRSQRQVSHTDVGIGGQR